MTDFLQISVSRATRLGPELDEARITEQAKTSQDRNANAGQAERATPSEITPVAAAPKKQRGLGKMLGLGCGVLILLILIKIAIAVPGLESPFNSPFGIPPFAFSTYYAQADTPAPTSAPAIYVERTGTGRWTSHIFTAPIEWKIDYRYDCSSLGSSKNFQVSVLGAYPGSYLAAVNELKKSGSGTTSVQGVTGDHIYLSVHSRCDWSIKAYS